MNSIFKRVLMNTTILIVISSCAAITEGPEGTRLSLRTKEPSTERELKLLSVDIPQVGNLSANVEYWTTVHFEANDKPEIRRACFNFSDGTQSCVDVQAKDVIYASHSYVRVRIHVPVGTKKIDCNAEYVRDGKIYRTNTVTYHVVVMKNLEE